MLNHYNDYFLGGLFPRPPPDGLPDLLGQFGFGFPVRFLAIKVLLRINYLKISKAIVLYWSSIYMLP